MNKVFTDIKTLGRIDSGKAVFHIWVEWMVILFCVFVYQYAVGVFVWMLPVLIVIVGTRMYALYSLLHDGIHYLLFKNKKVNDWVTAIFLAGPLFISLDTMRANHFKHHKYLLTENDPEYQLSQYPEFQFPLSKWAFLKIVFLDITGLNFLKYRVRSVFLFFSKRQQMTEYFTTILLVSLGLLGMYVLYIAGLLDDFFLLWLLPYMTVYQLLNRMRAYTEHFNLPKGVNTRSLKFNPFLSFFASPYNLGYHEAHHLYPYIPRYNLEKLHEWAKVNGNELYEETSMKKLIGSLFKKQE